jgi:hypothetical protein
MKEEDAARLFKAASYIGWLFEIDLMGDEAVVPLEGPGGEGDYRISDSEHIVHELAHVVVYGLDLYPPDTATVRLANHASTLPEQEQRINEVETFSVTAEVMRQLGVETEEGTYTDSMEIAIHGIELPEGHPYVNRKLSTRQWVLEMFRTFHQTERGRAAVEKLVGLMRSAGA